MNTSKILHDFSCETYIFSWKMKEFERKSSIFEKSGSENPYARCSPRKSEIKLRELRKRWYFDKFLVLFQNVKTKNRFVLFLKVAPKNRGGPCFFEIFLWFRLFSALPLGDHATTLFFETSSGFSLVYGTAPELEGTRKKFFFMKKAYHLILASFSLSSLSPRQIRARAASGS